MEDEDIVNEIGSKGFTESSDRVLMYDTCYGREEDLTMDAE